MLDNEQRANMPLPEDVKKTSKGVALFAGMGTGKTLMAISLINVTKSNKVLVMCPMAVFGSWPNEYLNYSAGDHTVVVLRSKSGKSMSIAAKAKMTTKALRDHEKVIIIVNHESAWRATLAKVLLANKWDMIIVDESHRIKNHSSKIAKFCHKIADRGKYRLALTGTEIPNSPTDIFSQYKFLNSAIFSPSQKVFERQFAVTKIDGRIVNVAGEKNLQSKIDSIAYRIGEDILDLPPVVHTTIETPLTDEARRLHDDIMEGLWTEIESLDPGDSNTKAVIATILLAQLIRCAQVTSGFVGGVVDVDDPYGEREVQEITGSSKIDMVIDKLGDIPVREKVVVFCRFQKELEYLEQVAIKTGRRYGEISGSRKDGLNSISKMNEDVDLLGVQLQAGGTGIDLTAASIVFYLSKDFSNANYEQSLKRSDRSGQTKSVKFYHFVTPDSVDERIEMSLAGKQSVAEWYREEAERRRMLIAQKEKSHG